MGLDSLIRELVPAARPRMNRGRSPSLGDVVAGRYHLVREIAAGPRSVVFEALHGATGRTVAVKLVPPDAPQHELAQERLARESRLLGTLRHAAIVEALDAGVCPELGPYLATEMLEGRTLCGIIAARRALGVPETLWIASRVGEALAHAHRRGVVHRDVKPTNVFVCKTHEGERLKLIDFGVGGEITSLRAHPSPKLTRAGEVLGTLEYMPPEQLSKPELPDPRSDQYALAVLVFECLTGTLPSLADRIAGPSQLPDMTGLGVPPAVTEALRRALAPAPAHRFDDVGAFVRALLSDRSPSCVTLLPRAAESAIAEPVAAPRSATTPEAPAERAPGPPPAVVARRRYARAPYVTPVRVVRAGSVNVDGRTEDISEGGMLIILPQNREHEASTAQEHVSVRFALPTTGAVVSCGATVRWIRDARGRAALGIEFDDPPTEVRKAIATYVALVGTGAQS